MDNKDNPSQAPDAANATSSIPKFCPLDGSILYRQYVPEIECDCWLCPECQYMEPIL